MTEYKPGDVVAIAAIVEETAAGGFLALRLRDFGEDYAPVRLIHAPALAKEMGLPDRDAIAPWIGSAERASTVDVTADEMGVLLDGILRIRGGLLSYAALIVKNAWKGPRGSCIGCGIYRAQSEMAGHLSGCLVAEAVRAVERKAQ